MTKGYASLIAIYLLGGFIGQTQLEKRMVESCQPKLDTVQFLVSVTLWPIVLPVAAATIDNRC